MLPPISDSGLFLTLCLNDCVLAANQPPTPKKEKKKCPHFHCDFEMNCISIFVSYGQTALVAALPRDLE